MELEIFFPSGAIMNLWTIVLFSNLQRRIHFFSERRLQGNCHFMEWTQLMRIKQENLNFWWTVEQGHIYLKITKHKTFYSPSLKIIFPGLHKTQTVRLFRY